MSLSVDGIWKTGVWDQTVWADGVWREGEAAPVFSGTIADISVTFDTDTHDYDISAYFTGATSYSIAPAVEAGWTFNTSTGLLTIDTDDAQAFGDYVVTGTNTGGDTDSNAFSVTVAELGLGGVKAKRRIKKVDRNFFPWTQQPDPIEEDFVKELKRPKLKIVKRAPQPDFDSTLESERLDRELVEELQRIEKERKKQASRRKKIEMLLLS